MFNFMKNLFKEEPPVILYKRSIDITVIIKNEVENQILTFKSTFSVKDYEIGMGDVIRYTEDNTFKSAVNRHVRKILSSGFKSGTDWYPSHAILKIEISEASDRLEICD